MTSFSTTLSSAVAATGVSLREVARTCDIDSSLLSRLCSGAIGPSKGLLRALAGNLNPDRFSGLTEDLGPELQLSYLRDCAVEHGFDMERLRLAFVDGPADEWWHGLPADLAEQLRAIGTTALADMGFRAVLNDLEPLGLRLLGALHDAAELEQVKRSGLYIVPPAAESAVAEDAPRKGKNKSAPPKGGRSETASALPRGVSQQPAV